MADQLYSGLGVRAAILTTDILAFLPVAGPPAQQADVAKLITLLNTIYAPITGGAYVLKAGDTMTGLLTIAQATANTSNLILSGQSLTGANAQSALSIAGTWNTSGNAAALLVNITNTASDAASRLLDVQTGGTSRFKVLAAGNSEFMFSNTATLTFTNYGGGGVRMSASGFWGFESPNGAGWEFTTLGVAVGDYDSTIVNQWWFGTAVTVNGLLKLVGQTSAFPAWKRSAAILQARLADDSLFTEIECSNIISNNAGAAFSTNTTLTNFAAAALGTISNAPTAGNPAKWVAFDDNGTTRYIPTWI